MNAIAEAQPISQLVKDGGLWTPDFEDRCEPRFVRHQNPESRMLDIPYLHQLQDRTTHTRKFFAELGAIHIFRLDGSSLPPLRVKICTWTDPSSRRIPCSNLNHENIRRTTALWHSHPSNPFSHGRLTLAHRPHAPLARPLSHLSRPPLPRKSHHETPPPPAELHPSIR